MMPTIHRLLFLNPTDEELEANRRGYLTKNQRAMLESQRKKAKGGGTPSYTFLGILVIIFVVSVVGLLRGIAAFAIVPIITFFLVALSYALNQDPQHYERLKSRFAKR